MKHKLTRRETAPPNLAAKALSHGLFRPKIEKDPKAYDRKVKHRGSAAAGPLSSFFSGEALDGKDIDASAAD